MTYPLLLRHACEQALAAGIFYQEAIFEFVIGLCGYGCNAQILDHHVIDAAAPDRARRDRELFSGIESQIKQAVRGAYVIVERRFPSDRNEPSRSTFETIVSDGAGNVAVGGKYHMYDRIPSAQAVLETMCRYEVYECRQACERIRTLNDSRHAIRKFELQTGKVFTNVMLPGHVKAFSKVTIAYVDFEAGSVRLLLAKRGSRTTSQSIVMASHFAAYAQLEAYPAMPLDKAGTSLRLDLHPGTRLN